MRIKLEFGVLSDTKILKKMSVQKKISEEYKLEIKELFNEVSSWKVKFASTSVFHVTET